MNHLKHQHALVLAGALVCTLVFADGSSPPTPAAAADSPPVVPSADRSSSEAETPDPLDSVMSAAPVFTFSGGPAGDETLAVSWQLKTTVPAGARRVSVDATWDASQGDGADTVLLVDGVAADGDPSIETALDADRERLHLTIDAPPPGATVALGRSVSGGAVPIDESSFASPVAASSSRAALTCGTSLPGDQDADLIPDDLERAGYTVVASTLVPWRDDLAATGHVRYVSDPRSCRTARDPYTDLEKVFAVMPGGTRSEARDPLVAAAPAVGVDLEKLVVTLNDTTSESTTRTHSFSTTHSLSRTLGGKLGLEGGVEGTSKPQGSIKASGEFNMSWTRGYSVTDGTSTAWQEIVNRSTSKAASLNGNVRYHNAGTAPVFDAHPTTNWVLQGEHTMATFRAGPNFGADALGAGETYPERSAAPLSIETINDAGTVDLTATADELERLGVDGEVTLDTTQTTGSYGRLVAGQLDPAAGPWGPILAGVREATGTLTLDAGTETIQRQVSAPDEKDPEDSTPRLNIRQAIDRAFGAHVVDGHRYYRSPNLADPSHRTPLLLDDASVLLTMDEATAAAIDDQLSPGQSVFDVEFRRGMKIGVKPADTFSDFETGDFTGWSGHGTAPGAVRPDGKGEISWSKDGLTPGNRYRIAFRSQLPSDGQRSSMKVVDARGLTLDLAPTPSTRVFEDAFVEFTASTSSVSLRGRADVDDLAFFSLGTTKRPDITWVTRQGENLRIPDTTTPLETQVDVLDALGRTEIDLVVSRSGQPVDLTDAVLFRDGSSIGAWNTSTTYKAKGHVNVPVLSTGQSALTLLVPRASSTGDCDNCFEPIAVVDVSVRESKPATVDFYYREGTSKHMCSFRFRALEVPGYRGELSQSANFKSSANSCKNDDAYYLKYQNMPVGTELSVFDSPDGSRNDDFFIWETKAASSGLLYLDARERPAEVTVQEQSYRNGLVGKVSRFELHYPGMW